MEKTNDLQNCTLPSEILTQLIEKGIAGLKTAPPLFEDAVFAYHKL